MAIPTQRENEIQLVQEAQKRGMTPDKIKEVVVAYRAQGGSKSATPAPVAPAQSFSKQNDAKHPILAAGGQAITALGKAIATPFTRTAGTIVGAAIGLGSKPEDEQAIQKMGMFQPYDTKREAVGGALQIGATLLPGAREVKGALAAATAAKVPQAVSQATVGGATGLGYGAGSGLEKSGRERSSVLQTVGDVSMSGTVGGATGLTVGAATGNATDWWNKPRAVPQATMEKMVAPKNDAQILQPKKPDITDITADKVEKFKEFIKAAPDRIAINAKETSENAAFLAKQPPEVRRAITNGVTTRDARVTANLDEPTKKVARQMIEQADLIARGDDGVLPADIAGKQLQKRIELAESVRQDVGERLGESVKGLKGEIVSSRTNVLKEMQKVPGLNGVSINNKGNLNFKGTAMSSSARESERKAINALWNDMRGRDAFNLHQLRQEIFDILGGRTKAANPPTEIEEKALEAIRKGIANSLDDISTQYKTINKEYVKIIEPIKGLRRFYRGLENASGDILDETSGDLMSRFSGKSKSGKQLLMYLGQIDDELTKRGIKPDVDLRKLNDFHDILQNYYLETVKPGGLAGQASLGFKKGLLGHLNDVAGKGVSVVSESMSQTDAVKRAALKSLLGL